MTGLLWCLLKGFSPALAAGEEEAARAETVTGRRAPPLQPARLDLPPPPPIQALKGMTLEQKANLPYPVTAYVGAEALGMDVALVADIQKGVDLVYRRSYNESIAHFTGVEKRWPGTGLGAVSETLVWQARMLENFDYRYDAEYAAASKRARAGLEAALKVPGMEGWEHFLLAGIVGVESIHAMRKGSYIGALQQAFSAMDHIQEANEAAPHFADLKIADGMYNYWRSVVTLSSDLLPDFEDKRAVGIAQLQLVEARGVFLGPAATLALAFTWIEEGNYKNALNSLLANRKAYPDNVVNNLLVASTWIFMGDHARGLAMLDEVLADDPRNRRAHYWKGVAYQATERYDEAIVAYKTYLNTEYMEKYQKSVAFFRLGQCYHRVDRHTDAELAWKSSVGIDGNDKAKAALDRLAAARKAGKIPAK